MQMDAKERNSAAKVFFFGYIRVALGLCFAWSGAKEIWTGPGNTLLNDPDNIKDSDDGAQ